MGFDTGDLLRKSVEEATRLREAERHAVRRPLMPGSSPPEQPGFPAVPHGSLDNSYQEDDFSINTPLECAPRSPTTVKMPSDGVHHSAANDRKDSGLFPQGFVMSPTGHQSSGKGSYGGKVKMLPPHLHLKGWDVSTEKYKEWYRSFELFMTAHQIPREQRAAPIVAACQDKAHQASKN
jgi:hypothetical protein